MCSLDIMFQRNPHDELLGKPEGISHDDVPGVVYAAQRNPQDELLGKPEGISHDDVPGVVYAATADADIWHRRLGHMNPRSMELLRRKE